MGLTHRLNVPSTEYIYTSPNLRAYNPFHIFKYWNTRPNPARYSYIGATGHLDQIRPDIFTEVEELYVSESIQMPSGQNGTLVLPSAGMGIIYGDVDKLNPVPDGSETLFVYGILDEEIALLSTEPNTSHTIIAGQTVTIIAKNREDIQALPIAISRSYTPIDEPIGFDNFKVQLQRHDYHGIGAEVSLDTLEFYGKAYNVIKSKYDEDIDSLLLYEVIDENSQTFYSGAIDFTTCVFQSSDYKSVKAKVGEIGAITTFNNRTKTEIDLADPKTVDGSSVAAPTWRSLHIPMKHLLYTILSKRTTDSELIQSAQGEGQETILPNITLYTWDESFRGTHAPNRLFLPIGVDPSVEFGEFTEQEPLYVTKDVSVVNPQYTASIDHVDKYGDSTIARIDAHLKLYILNGSSAFYQMAVDGPYNNHSTTKYRYYVRLKAISGDGSSVISGENVLVEVDGNGRLYTTINVDLLGSLPAGSAIKYYLEFTPGYIYTSQGVKVEDSYSQAIYASIKILQGSYFKITMYDNLPEKVVNADMLLVHDALNVVAKAVSENGLSVKSEWYQTPESQVNAGGIRTDANGGSGALKAITNGYHIRGLFTDGDLKRNMPVSFKSLVEALDAMDCIGWGFSTESGQLCVRVEKWDWFYKDSLITCADGSTLTLTNVAEVTKEVLTERIPTELNIGYKKYATQEQYNSIDSPHGTRTFVNGIKALTKALTKESEFIADNYAIEETRRARTQVNETEETTYDENIFVFELLRATQGNTIRYSIGHTSTNAQEVGRADEFINAKLTPRHMAARWRAFLFSANNSTPFRFTTGEINYKASFGCVDSSYTEDDTTYQSLTSDAETSPQVENDDISYIHAKFKAEKITFSYPLTLAQYNAIKANPYGLVSVNGEQGWILDFKYNLMDGMADFALIAKYTN